MLILQRSGDDLRGTRRSVVHQERDRIVRLRPGRLDPNLLALAVHATPGVDDEAFAQPRAGDLHGLAEKAPRVVQDVEDSPSKLPSASWWSFSKVC